MEDCHVPFRLPNNPVDNDEICDRHGHTWKYDANSDTWMLQGQGFTVPLVSSTTSGVITPEIYAKIEMIKASLAANPYTLKIAPAVDAYWYYFRSANKLFRFKRQGASDLSIEVDTSRLYQIFSKITCQGPEGPGGPCGDAGRDGLPGPLESIYKASADGKKLQLAVAVPTPLETPISLRLYRIDSKWRETPQTISGDCAIAASPTALIASSQACDDCTSRLGQATVEIEYFLDGTHAVLADEDGLVESVELTYKDGILCGTINGTADWGTKWFFKARQRGPDGDPGQDAPDFFCMVETTIDDPDLMALCPLSSLRASSDLRTIFLIRSCFDKVCVSKLRFPTNAAALVPTELITADQISGLLAVQRTTDEHKSIVPFQYELAPKEFEKLSLPNWTPLPGCVTLRHFNNFKFDWVTETDVTTEVQVWDALGGDSPAKYPFDIITQTAPTVEECCQDEAFFVDNENDCDTVNGSICGPIDFVLVIDVGATMASQIDAIKESIAAVVELLRVKTAGDFRLGLIKFADTAETVVTMSEENRTEFTNAIAALAVGTYQNEAKAWPAAITLASASEWRLTARQIVLLVTDALPADDDGEYSVDAANDAIAAAVDSRSKVSVIYCGTSVDLDALGMEFWGKADSSDLYEDVGGLTRTTTEGGTVRRWNDHRPGSVRYFSRSGTPDAVPALTLDGIATGPAVVFTTGQLLQMVDSLFSAGPLTSATIVASYTPTTAGLYERLLTKDSYTGEYTLGIQRAGEDSGYGVGGNNLRLTTMSGKTWVRAEYAEDDVETPAGETNTVHSVWNNGLLSFYKNGVFVSEHQLAHILDATTNNRGWSLGAEGRSGSISDAGGSEVTEFMIFSRALTPSDLEALNGSVTESDGQTILQLLASETNGTYTKTTSPDALEDSVTETLAVCGGTGVEPAPEEEPVTTPPWELPPFTEGPGGGGSARSCPPLELTLLIDTSPPGAVLNDYSALETWRSSIKTALVSINSQHTVPHAIRMATFNNDGVSNVTEFGSGNSSLAILALRGIQNDERGDAAADAATQNAQKHRVSQVHQALLSAVRGPTSQARRWVLVMSNSMPNVPSAYPTHNPQVLAAYAAEIGLYLRDSDIRMSFAGVDPGGFLSQVRAATKCNQPQPFRDPTDRPCTPPNPFAFIANECDQNPGSVLSTGIIVEGDTRSKPRERSWKPLLG